PPPVNPAPPDVHLQNAKPANPSEHSDTFVCFAKRVAPSVSLAFGPADGAKPEGTYYHSLGFGILGWSEGQRK
ncbi:MAG: hypothetical protein WBW33_14645, partial [Bryobacteraceae bacterium]